MRCDLGPVDNPNEPPCGRCRRESKECYFSATRRKRRGDSGDDVGGDRTGLDDYASYNRRRRISHSQAIPVSPLPRVVHSRTSITSDSQSPTSPSIWISHERTQQPGLYLDGSTPARANTPGDQEVTNEAAAALFHSPINQPADALHLLLEASGRTGDLHRHASVSQSLPQTSASRKHNSTVPNNSRGPHRPSFSKSPERSHHSMDIDPAITGNAVAGSEDGSSRSRETLKIWSRLRFVRAGWFTVREAISYID